MLRLAALSFLLCLPASASEIESLKSNAGVRFDRNAAFPKLPEAEIAPGAVLKGARPPAEAGEPMLLSDLAERLSKDPAAVADLAKAVRGALAEADIPLSPELEARLLQALREVDRDQLDGFPTLSRDATHRMLHAFAAWQGAVDVPSPGPGVEELVLPGTPQLPSQEAHLKLVGHGVYFGDLTRKDLGSAYGDSAALAAALNRLALGGELRFGGRVYTQAGDLLDALLASGHTVEALDRRYFANFGDLWFEEGGKLRPVATPLLMDTGVVLPSGRRLVLPIPHAHLQFVVRGPAVKADINFYMGVDGAASFHPETAADQPWAGGRTVKTWSGSAAVELIRRSALAKRELREKADKYKLPLGGYGSLGVCTDIHAMIIGEPMMPHFQDPGYFQDGMTIDTWAKAVARPSSGPMDLRELAESVPFDDVEKIPLPEVRESVRELKALLSHS